MPVQGLVLRNLERGVLISAALLLFGYYFVRLNWSIDEFGRSALGILMLWAPLGALLYVALIREIPDAVVRLAFSFAGTYTLTTVLYFACAVLRIRRLFDIGLLLAAAGAVWLGRRAAKAKSLALPRINAALLLILAASLVTTIPYSTTLTTAPSGDRILTGYQDLLYHVGLEYELSRHVPPLDATIRGGTPERAYHMFPHLTVALIARFTGQSEMLRAHSVYHYAAITVLICLAMYGIGSLLAGARTGGYVCALLPFLLAVATRPIIPNALGYFFFTALPHATSTVFPTLWSSPQMYSGVAVMFGVLLGIAVMVRGSRTGKVAVLSGLMVAALLRFRVHCWIVAMPAFLIFVSTMWWRSKSKTWVFSEAAAVVVSGLLYAEMLLPVYLHGTSEVHFARNALSRMSYYKIWPASASVQQLLHHVFSGQVYAWAWQIACIAGFTLFNVIGAPLLAGIVAAPLKMRKDSTLAYYAFTAGLILFSIAGAACLTTGYDGYSVPGQLVYHIGWYALPLEGVALAWLVSYVRQRTRWASAVLIAAAIASGIASWITQRERLPALSARRAVITPAAWDAFHFVKEWTPDSSVVLSSSPVDRVLFTVSGLGARSAYLDMPNNPVDVQAVALNPRDNRSAMLSAMGAARNPAALCSVITSTPITHILEQVPYRIMPNVTCLQRLWTARDGVTSVWQVKRP